MLTGHFPACKQNRGQPTRIMYNRSRRGSPTLERRQGSRKPFFASVVMRIRIPFGLDHLEVEVAEDRHLALHRAPHAPPLADPAAAVRDALDQPLRYPPLWRGLTPDDHVTIVVDEQLPRVGMLLTQVLEHISRAEVAPEAITLLCPPSDSHQDWLEDLPEAFEDVHVEMHDPTDRKRLAYLATTKQGRRLYISRTAVDADQLVVLGRRGYDPLLGY